MAGPITWRTVNGPSLAEAGRPMESAQRSFDNAFTGLGDVLKQREAVDSANWTQLKENNTQDFLNKLYSAQGAEGFKALQDSGELQRMLTANGAQIDRVAARSAMDGRLGVLQQRDKQAGEFSDWTTTREQRPIVNGIMTDIYRGNTELAAKTLAENPNLLNAPDIQKALTEHKRALVVQGREDTRFEWDKDGQKWKVAAEAQKALLRPIEVQAAQQGLKVQDAQIRASNNSAAASAESVLTSRATRDRLDAETTKALQLKKLGAALDGNLYKEGVYKDTDSVDIAKLMKDTGAGGDGPGDNDQRRKVLERINKLAQTGIELTQAGLDGKPVKTTVPLPLGTVKAALLGSGDRLFSWNEGYADSFEKNLKARLQASYNRPGADGKPMAANRAVDDYQAFQEIMRGSSEIVQAPSGRKK